MKKLFLALTMALTVANAAQAYDPYAPNDVVREQRVAPARPALKKYELIIRNHSYSDIITVQAKSMYMRNLSVDLIPNYSIKPGRQGLVNLYDPDSETCDWFIKTTSEDGTINSKTLNVCTHTVLHINP